KGNAALFQLYSKRRLKTPLKRTNPEKGFGVDPGFQPIGWDEALETVAGWLRQIRSEDPRKLYFTTFDLSGLDIYRAWCLGFGTVASPFSSGFYCGNNVHNIHEMTEVGLEADPDAEFCRYLLLVGSQFGAAVNYDVMRAAAGIAKKRPGGVKVVSVDPVGSYSAAKAEEWVPIRPGTDGAFLMGLVNLLINEYKIYDSRFLTNKTNAPYLVGRDGFYVRNSGKPLVWSTSKKKAIPQDEAAIVDLALEGEYVVDGMPCTTGFELMKQHAKKYTPEYVSEITTIPVETIRRIAKEFGEAACIGQTIELGGKELPYRPVACVWYRGLSAHSHSMLSGMAAETLNVLMGAIDVPGGILASGQMPSIVTEDGLVTAAPGSYFVYPAYPSRKVVPPLSPDLFELFPVACYSRPFFIFGMTKPEQFKSNFGVDMLIEVRANFAKTSVPKATLEQLMGKIRHVVCFSTEINETSEFADIVFPDLHYAERVGIGLNQTRMLDRSGHLPEKWYGQKPAVRAPFDTPWSTDFISNGQILLELARRAGFLVDVNKSWNFVWKLKDQYKLDPEGKYDVREMAERAMKNLMGDSHDWAWFIRDGLYVKERPAERMYPGAFREGRIHFYYEFMTKAGEEVDKVTKELGIPWDCSDYQPMPDWKPCPSYDPPRGFDMFLINFKIPQQGFSVTDKSNPVLQQLTDRHRDNDLLINPKTAEEKNIRDGDTIMIENTVGVKAKGRARLTELVHPEVIGCQGSAGRFARSLGNSEISGVHFNDMIVFDEKHVDYVTAALDACVRVKITRAS
ncbi:MAG: molybdopterin-dependent oxidoreductase, partial [Nitrososphaerota archaeon]|nr:molybdopterin-dependent oxidoreductase [Nitrososphaerota archaeon]